MSTDLQIWSPASPWCRFSMIFLMGCKSVRPELVKKKITKVNLNHKPL